MLLLAGRVVDDGRLRVGRDCVLGAVRSVREGRRDCVGRVEVPERTPSVLREGRVAVGRLPVDLVEGRTLLPEVPRTALVPRDGRELRGRMLSVPKPDGRGRIVFATPPG